MELNWRKKQRKMEKSTLDMYINNSDGGEWWVNTECEKDSKEHQENEQRF